MYVLRRTVGTAITISAGEAAISMRLVGIDFLGACALIEVKNSQEEHTTKLEMGPGEVAELHDEVRMQLLRLAYATHEGTPARVAEFGFDAPRSITIRKAESNT